MSKEKSLKEKMLKKYTPPHFNVYVIKMEEGLAANSTNVIPKIENGSLPVEDWNAGSDVNGNLDW